MRITLISFRVFGMRYGHALISPELLFENPAGQLPRVKHGTRPARAAIQSSRFEATASRQVHPSPCETAQPPQAEHPRTHHWQAAAHMPPC